MSNKINVVLPSSDRVHILSGYQEVTETLLWGLAEIGYDASFTINKLKPHTRNIVFRGDDSPISDLKTFPADTIIYNLEQSYEMYSYTERPKKQRTADRWDRYIHIRKNFEVWDYSHKNISAMLTVDSKMPVKYVPIGFAPILQNIARPQVQDIDVLIYGMPHTYRLEVFQKLGMNWFRCLFVCGLYGQARDELIGRSKIILNLTSHGPESIYPIVRASYLLANRKLVISELCPKLQIEMDILNAVKFCSTEVIHLFCQYWLTNDSERLEAENKGFDIMARRDIRSILSAALG